MNGSWDAYLVSPADFTGADVIFTNLAKERDPGDIERSPLSVVTGNVDLYRQTSHLLYDPLNYLVNCLSLMFHF